MASKKSKKKKELEFLILPVELTKYQFPQLINFCDYYVSREYLRTGRAPKECKILRSDFKKIMSQEE